MLTLAELKKLVKAHNILSKIVIPPKTNRDNLIKIIEDKGYVVNHEKKLLEQKVKRGKQITLKQAEEITKPKPKTELQQLKSKERKEKKEEEQKKKEREIKKQAIEQYKKIEKKEPAPKLKPISQLKPKAKKEDEVRQATKTYPAIPKNIRGKRVNVKIGEKPKGRIEVGALNVGKVIKSEPKKEEPKKDINAPIEMKDFKKDILKFKKVVITNAIKEVKQLKTKKEIEKYYRDLSKIINDRYINVIDNEEYDDEVQDMKDKFFDYTEKLINKLPIVSVKDLETGKNKTITSIKDMKAFIDKMNKYKKELQKTNPNSTKTQKVEDYVDITLQKKLVELMKKLPDEKEEDKPLSAKAQEKINKLKQELE